CQAPAPPSSFFLAAQTLFHQSQPTRLRKFFQDDPQACPSVQNPSISDRFRDLPPAQSLARAWKIGGASRPRPSALPPNPLPAPNELRLCGGPASPSPGRCAAAPCQNPEKWIERSAPHQPSRAAVRTSRSGLVDRKPGLEPVRGSRPRAGADAASGLRG
ncbi:hypothetical protein P7K49_035637, partial [Saguinus oedipus]